ncbi:MAG: TlpA family protein disulfide reductase [Betaproteobacteria bacterium]|nr:TlpA family protein disulfide reductase [Betaproteobacteria bacterium]
MLARVGMTLCAAVVLLAGCGSSQPAPDVTFTSLNGKEIPLQTLRGEVVLVNFWATSCDVCVKEMPDLAQLQRRFGERGMTLVAVAMHYDPPNHVLDYAKSAELPFVVSLDPLGKIEQAFGDISGTPTTFVIDRRGRIASRIQGAPDFPRLHTLIEAKLAEPA